MHVEEIPWPVYRNGSSGAPVLLLHGFLGCKEDMTGVIDRLEPGYEGIAADFPGHGQHTLMDQVPDYPDVLAGLEKLRQSLGISSWHLAGYSMGGRFALAYALVFPERVKTLTMISASPGIEDRNQRETRRIQDEAWALRFENEDAAGVLRDWYRQGVFSSLAGKPELCDAIIQRRGQGTLSLMADALRKWGQGVSPSAWSRLDGLRVPSLWISGEEDTVYVEMCRRVAARLDTAQVAVIPCAGHAVHLENPDGLVHSMVQFMTENT